MRQIILTIIASIPLAAQDPPAAIVYIYREQIKPGKIAAYTQIEEAAARFCARANCPNPYLAISSITGPDEVWWINGFDSIDTSPCFTFAPATPQHSEACASRLGRSWSAPAARSGSIKSPPEPKTTPSSS